LRTASVYERASPGDTTGSALRVAVKAGGDDVAARAMPAALAAGPASADEEAVAEIVTLMLALAGSAHLSPP
jgi:hypothetical protein